MKVDFWDDTLICEHQDLQETLSYFKNDRKTPKYIERAILDYIYKQLHLKINENDSIEKKLNALPAGFIQKSLQDINSMFNTNKKIDYSKYHLSYLLYYLTANLFKVWKPLLDLHIKSLLKVKLKVLDIGTGPGSIPIGIIEFYKELAMKNSEINFILEFTLIETEQEFLDIALFMIQYIKEEVPSNLQIKIVDSICEIVGPKYTNHSLKEYDLITMSNFFTINEKNNHEEGSIIINGFIKHISEDGSILIIEPGDRPNCMSLKSIRNQVLGDTSLNLYSPCVRLWEDKRTYNCSCFSMARSYWGIPLIYKFLVGKGLNKARRIDIPFNYIVLRKDGQRKYEIETNHQYFLELKDINSFIDRRINIKAIIRSVIQRSGNMIILLCDGSRSFYDPTYDVKVQTTEELLLHEGIDVKLIAGEKLTLNRVLVRKVSKGINLEIDNKSSIKVDY